MVRTKILAVVAFCLTGALLSACAAQTTTSADLQFVTHLTAGMPEQDVYVPSAEADDQVVRATLDQLADPEVQAATIWASSTPTEHDPFGVGEEPMGPFGKGQDLGITMGDWLAATGTGTYSVHGDSAALEMSFQNLVPGGLYSIWCTRITVPPDPVIFDVACGEWDGTTNTFVADADGAGTLSIPVMQPMLYTDDEHLSMIALAYHSDRNTNGPLPGDFGTDTHVQAFAVMPPAGDPAWESTMTAMAVASGE